MPLSSENRRADQTSRGCILVVDDDPDIRAVLKTALSKLGYLVETAGDGAEGLSLMRALRPALILLDVHMPVTDGAAFREAQRRDPELIRIPTVVMTGAASEPVLDLAVEETLRKPTRLKDVLRIVRKHCVPSA